jgi:hypothetical protein
MQKVRAGQYVVSRCQTGRWWAVASNGGYLPAQSSAHTRRGQPASRRPYGDSIFHVFTVLSTIGHPSINLRYKWVLIDKDHGICRDIIDRVRTAVVGIDFADVADGRLFVLTAPMQGLQEAHVERIDGTLNLPAGTSIPMPGDLAVARVALPQAAPCRGRDSRPKTAER